MSKNTAKMNMISQQIRTLGVHNQRVIDAFYELPRESFVPDAFKESAYADFNIPLEFNEYMMTPSVEAKLLEALDIKANEQVLEIGTGSGFLTGLLAKLANTVVTVDMHSALITKAKHQLKSLGIFNIKFISTDAILDFNDQATYDVIVITGAMPNTPHNFCQKLTIGGRLFVIIGQKDAQVMEATMITRTNESEFQIQKLFETVIPPLHSVKQPETFTF